jgi:hypothetical protein
LHPGAKLALGSFGSWEPLREVGLLTPEEADFCLPIELNKAGRSKGLMMAGTLPGVYNSSTRTELAAIIASLSKPGGLHIALDNMSVVNGVMNIIEGKSRRKRPWNLRPDGDLWQIAEQAIAARNPQSLQITWTKGHATWEHIVGGLVFAGDAVGNGQADLAAEHGHRAVDRQALQEVLSYQARAQAAYVQIMVRFQKLALAIIKADWELRDAAGFVKHGKKAEAEWIDIPAIANDKPDFSEGEALELLDLPASLHGKLAECQVFWSHTRWKPATVKPTTWLEAFAVLRYWGVGTSPTWIHTCPGPLWRSSSRPLSMTVRPFSRWRPNLGPASCLLGIRVSSFFWLTLAFVATLRPSVPKFASVAARMLLCT